MIRHQLSRKLVVLSSSGCKSNNTSSSIACLASSSLLSTALRTYFGHEVAKGVRGESERQGPSRVPSVKSDRTIFDPTLRSPDEVREDFDRENEKIEMENAKMRAAYSGSHNHKIAAAGMEAKMKGTDRDGGGGSLGNREDLYGDDLEAAVKNATPTRNQFSSDEPDLDINPHRNSHVGSVGFDDQATTSQDSFLSGNIHDRESIRVRGQKPPPDLPITDDEVWKHPTAKNMRVAGIFLLFFVLDVCWRLTTDPFNEGERYVKYGLRHNDGAGANDSVPWLEKDEEKSKKQIREALALRDAMLPWRQ